MPVCTELYINQLLLKVTANTTSVVNLSFFSTKLGKLVYWFTSPDKGVYSITGVTSPDMGVYSITGVATPDKYVYSVTEVTVITPNKGVYSVTCVTSDMNDV